MPRLILLLFLLCTFSARAGRANRYFDYFNTEAFWNRMELVPESTDPVIGASDTCILIASNRAPGADSLRFMSEERGDGTLRFLFVYTGGGRWHLRPCESLREGVRLMNRRLPRPWVIYTEGMGKIFTSDVDRGMRMAGEYGVSVILLDYPSIHTGYGSYKNYRFAWNNSSSIYRDFAPVFDTLYALRERGLIEGPASMFFHSMGNNLARKLVQERLLPGDGTGSPWIDNLVLNAPCVPRRGSKRWIDSLRIAKRISVNYNPEDRTLKLASIAGFRGILGLGPKRKTSSNARYFNFNAIAGSGHSNFLGLYGRPMPSDAAKAHYRQLLWGLALPLEDSTAYEPDGRHGNIYRLR